MSFIQNINFDERQLIAAVLKHINTGKSTSQPQEIEMIDASRDINYEADDEGDENTFMSSDEDSMLLDDEFMSSNDDFVSIADEQMNWEPIAESTGTKEPIDIDMEDLAAQFNFCHISSKAAQATKPIRRNAYRVNKVPELKLFHGTVAGTLKRHSDCDASPRKQTALCGVTKKHKADRKQQAKRANHGKRHSGSEELGVKLTTLMGRVFETSAIKHVWFRRKKADF
ncbi:hypothetical protein M426DRAFT_24200 [Hypoxylon sp. CI-4A]|nr:hypothetical protein M426DRAFT_24200 [Hypoxylon sp. CI-4A]